MKRKSSPWLSHSPRKRQSVPSNPSQEKKPVTQSTQNSAPCLSIHQQAEPYRLTTVRFPIDALSARWGKGKNRPIDEHHKHELHESFRTQGLLRTDSKNWLRIACAKGDVDRMEAALQAGKGPGDKQEGTESETASWPSYMRWREVNAEVQVELIAGNHRVAALKDYLQDEPAAVDERWWICEVYDRGIIVLLSPCLCYLILTSFRYFTFGAVDWAACEPRGYAAARHTRPHLDGVEHVIPNRPRAVEQVEPGVRADRRRDLRFEWPCVFSSPTAGDLMA